MMIKSVSEFFEAINSDLDRWGQGIKPWFRGESGKDPCLCPKVAKLNRHQENHLLQSFRRQAGGLSNVPHREDTDLWLFLAQHYGISTRLLDWTEGALLALYFAINKSNPIPRVYMLNPRRLNDLAGSKTYPPNYPLSWVKGGQLYVSLAWQNRELDPRFLHILDELKLNMNIPIAFPATYQDQRMIAQRSCFTIHGTDLRPIQTILKTNSIDPSECIFEYQIYSRARRKMLRDLSILGVSAATIFPDLDHLASDLKSDIEGL